MDPDPKRTGYDKDDEIDNLPLEVWIIIGAVVAVVVFIVSGFKA